MKKVVLVPVVLFIAQACTAINEDNSISIENDSATLNSRMSYESEAISIDISSASQKLSSRAKPADEISLTRVASVSPPVHDGITLQANEIIIKGPNAYVGYNVQGETFLGAVDVFDITDATNPVLVSSALFPQSDINGLAIHGNTLYMATASENAELNSAAALEIIDLDGLQLTDSHAIIDLASFAATDVDIHGDVIYVTTGADGGTVTQLDRTTLETLDEILVDDARGVDSDGNGVGVVAGTDARLLAFNGITNANEGDFALSGATLPFSKSTVEIKKAMAVLGLGDGGMQVVCLDDGSVVGSIAPPSVAGLDAGETVTNAATAYKRSIFISNGEAGVYVAIADSNIASNSCALDNLELVGKLQLGVNESVNHVTYRHDMLFVAAGTGGLQIIKVDDAKASSDDDDS